MSSSAGLAFTPHVIHIGVGEVLLTHFVCIIFFGANATKFVFSA